MYNRLVPVSSTSRAYTLTGQYYHSSIVHTKIMALNKCLIIVDPECEGHGFVSRNRLSSAAIGKQSRFNVQKTLEVRLCRVDGKNYPVYLLTYLLILIWGKPKMYIYAYSVRMRHPVSHQEYPPHPTTLS